MNHCIACWTEFVDGVVTCSDCDGPLTPGPLPEKEQRSAARASAARPEMASLAAIDSFLEEVPGEKAEFIAEALKFEGITSRLECKGMVQHRGPERAAAVPIAVTLPVSIFVARADLERAHEIIESVAQEDLIGEEWAAASEAEPPTAHAAEPVAEAASPEERGEVEEPLDLPSEGVGSKIVIFIVIGVVILFFMLRR